MTPTRVVTCGMARRTCRKRWRRATAIGGVAAVAVICAACGGGYSPTTASTRPPATTTTTSPREAGVLAAYRASQAAFQQAVKTANPTLPTLTQTMTGAQLHSVRRALESDKLDGIIGQGNIQLHPRLASIHATNAVVLDCAFDSSELVYVATGKPVPPATPPQHEAIRSQLTEVSAGTWKVAVQHVTTGDCPARY